jgi:hypothetical protein
MAPFFRRLRGDGPFNALRTLTLYNLAESTVRRQNGDGSIPVHHSRGEKVDRKGTVPVLRVRVRRVVGGSRASRNPKNRAVV